MQRHAVALLEATEVLQHRGHLVHPHVEFLVGDVLNGFVLRLGHEVDSRLVLVPGEMTIDAVVTDIYSAADKPFPERRFAGVERDVPGLIPVEQIGVFFETVWKIFETEPVKHFRVGQVGLRDEFFRRVDVGLFLPVDRDLGLGHFIPFAL